MGLNIFTRYLSRNGTVVGVTADYSEVNILDGATLTTAELNALDISANSETIAKTTAVSVVKTYTAVDSTTGTGAITLAAPDASMLGRIKVIEMTVDNGDITLALTNVVGQSSGTTATFNDAGDQLVLVGAASKWIVLKERGISLS